MSLKQRLLSVVIGVALSVGIASADDVNQYAVLDFSISGGVKQSDATALVERYEAQLRDSKGLSVLPCSEVKNTLKVNRWNASEYTSLQLAAQAAGQILKVQYVVFGSVRQVGEMISLEIQMLDVKSSKLLHNAVTDTKGGIEDLVEKGVAANIEKLLGSPVPPDSDKAAGAAAVAGTQAVATPVEKGGDDPSWMRRNWKWVAGGVGGAAVIGAVAGGGGGSGDSEAVSYLGTWVGDGGRLVITIGESESSELWRWGGDSQWDRRGGYELNGNSYIGHGQLSDNRPEAFFAVFSSPTTGEAWLETQHPSHVSIQKQ